MSFATRASIKIALPLLICVLVLLTVAALAAIFYPRIEVELARLARQNLTDVHRRINDQLEQYFGVAERLNVVNREIMHDRGLGWSDIRTWRGILNEQLRAFDTLSAIVWGDASGNATFVARYPGGYRFGITEGADGIMKEYALAEDGSISAETIAHYPYDPRQRPWYRDALLAGRPAWGGIYVWAQKEDVATVLSVPYVAPMQDSSGAVRSVITVEFSLVDIGRFLASLDIGESGLAYIMDGQGLLVASSTNTPALEPGTRNRRRAADADHPLIAHSAQAISDGLMGDVIPKEPFYDSINFHGVDMLFMATPLLRAGDLRWLVVTLVPEREFLGGIHEARRHGIAVALIAILVAVIMSFGMASYITRPIVRLSEHVRRIGRGDLGSEIQLREFPEFMRLSAAINRMTEGLRERTELRESLAMAMEVQQRLLPTATPEVPGLDIAGRSVYCDETGGDYFDYLEIAGRADDTAVIATGDVSGHGIASAMFMASARGILRSRSHDARTLSELLTHMNLQISEDSSGGRFMTMLLVMVSALRRELRWASAGHRPPMIYDLRSNVFTDLEGADLPLGVTADTGYREFSYPNLRSGQLVLLATDGLWEGKNAAGEIFGMQRVKEQLRRHAVRPAGEIASRLITAVEEFRGTQAQSDDITFVIVKVKL